jgi:hemerythrin
MRGTHDRVESSDVRRDRWVDSHHQRIIELINTLQNALLQGADKSITREILIEVANYTIYHFFAEEEMVEAYGYPDYFPHRQEHRDLACP